MWKIASVSRMSSVDCIKKVTVNERWKEVREFHVDIWRKNVPGRRKSWCKSLRCLLASWGRERNRRPVWLELSD